MAERLGRLGPELAGPQVIDRPLPLDQVAQTPGLDQLHRDVVHAANLVHLVHLHDVRVLERRHGAGLADQLLGLDGALAALDRLGQHLEGDLPAQHRVLGAEDPAHGALPEQASEPEPPDALAHPRGRGVQLGGRLTG